MDTNINLNLNKTTWTQEPKSEIVRMGSDKILEKKHNAMSKKKKKRVKSFFGLVFFHSKL